MKFKQVINYVNESFKIGGNVGGDVGNNNTNNDPKLTRWIIAGFVAVVVIIGLAFGTNALDFEGFGFSSSSTTETETK